MKVLIPKTCDAIIYGKKCRQSGHTIAKNLEYSKMAVYNLLKQLCQTDSSIPKKWTDHLSLLNIPSWQELKAFVQKNSKNRRFCLKKLATVWIAYINQPISEKTIHCNFKKIGISACIPLRKPAMTEAHCQARLEWARVHEKWTTK